MKQSRRSSLIEAALNASLGYVIAVGTQMLVFPLFDIHIPFHDNMAIAICFTGISLARSYVLRRWFNGRLHRAAERLAGTDPAPVPAHISRRNAMEEIEAEFVERRGAYTSSAKKLG